MRVKCPIHVLVCLYSSTFLFVMPINSICHSESARNDTFKRSHQKSKNRSAFFDNRPFDNTVTFLPLNYIGHDLIKIYENMSRIENKFMKDEFENNEQYDLRISKLLKKPILGDIHRNDLIAFVPKIEHAGEIEYNADIETIIFRIYNTPIFNDSGEIVAYYGIDGPILNVKQGHYIGENIFGATRTIKKVTGKSLVFGIANKDGNISDRHSNKEYIYDAKEISIAYAKKLKKDLRIAFIFRIEGISKGKFRKKPTIDNLLDLTAEYLYVLGNVKEVWMFDSKSGNILNKYHVHND